MALARTWHGTVGRNTTTGKITLDLDAREAFGLMLTQHVGQRFTIKFDQKPRSLRQNAFYHGVVVPLIAEHTGYSTQEAHDALRYEFLREGDGHLVKVRSTADLSTAEFEDYVERVRVFAAQEMGIVVPLPNEPT